MTNLSELFPVSPIRNIYRDFFSATRTGYNADGSRDASYLDITIPAVINTSKCKVHIDGHALAASAGFAAYSGSVLAFVQNGSYATYEVYGRLINATTLRVSTNTQFNTTLNTVGFVGQYEIVEYC